MHCQTISLAHYFTRKAFLLQLIRSKLCEVNDGRVRPYYLTFVCQMASFIWENKSFYFCISTVITERLSITEKESEMKLGTKWPFDLTNILWTCGLIIGCSWVLGDSFLFFFLPFFLPKYICSQSAHLRPELHVHTDMFEKSGSYYCTFSFQTKN